MGEDLRTMLCADNLAMARSSLIHLLGFHSTAGRLYFPWKCDAELSEITRIYPETKVILPTIRLLHILLLACLIADTHACDGGFEPFSLWRNPLLRR